MSHRAAQTDSSFKVLTPC